MKCTALCPCWRSHYDYNSKTTTIKCWAGLKLQTVGVLDINENESEKLECITPYNTLMEEIHDAIYVLLLMQSRALRAQAKDEAEQATGETEEQPVEVSPASREVA